MYIYIYIYMHIYEDMKIFNIKNMFTKNILAIQFIFMIHTISYNFTIHNIPQNKEKCNA